MSYQVFISYSHIDSQIAHGLCYKLEDEGIKCWIAPRDIKAGDVWAKAISKSIPKCKVMLLVLSSNSNSSDQVLREVELAVQKKLVIIPVRIDDIVPTEGMSYYLATTHWINIKGKQLDSKFSIVSKQIRDILGIVEEKSVQVRPAKEKTFEEKVSKAKTTEKEAAEKLKDINAVKKGAAGLNKKTKFIIGLPLLLIAVVIVVLIMNWNYLFNKNSDSEVDLNVSSEPIEEIMDESTPEPKETLGTTEIENTLSAEQTPNFTPEPEEIIYTSEDLGMSPDEQITFSDSNLDNCIGQTLEHLGWGAGDRSIESVLEIETLIISTTDAEENFVLAGIEREVMLSGYNDYYKCVMDNTIYSLEGLEYLKNLKNLIITGHSLDDVSALKPLESLERLEIIYLIECKITNIEFLSSYPNIHFIGLDRNDITDISVLKLYKDSLVNLTFSGCKKIENFSVVAELDNLIGVALDGTSFNNIDILKDLQNLIAIRLSHTNVDNWEALGTIASVQSMESLFLSYTQINDISFLKNYSNLQDLYCDNTYISNIEVLGSLRTLKNLYIMNTDVTDFSVLDGMHVEEIYMDQKLYDDNLALGQKLIVNGSRIYTENGYMGD